MNLLVKLEQGNLDVPDYTRKFNDYYSFWKSEFFENFGTYLCIMGLRSRTLRAELMSAYSLEISILYLPCNCTLLEVTCVGYRPLLEGIYSGINYNRRVQKPLVLVEAERKDKTHTQRVDILNDLISSINLL